jgi:hypothetical protein
LEVFIDLTNLGGGCCFDRNERLSGWETVLVEKRVSPLRCSQKREQLRSK